MKARVLGRGPRTHGGSHPRSPQSALLPYFFLLGAVCLFFTQLLVSLLLPIRHPLSTPHRVLLWESFFLPTGTSCLLEDPPTGLQFFHLLDPIWMFKVTCGNRCQRPLLLLDDCLGGGGQEQRQPIRKPHVSQE